MTSDELCRDQGKEVCDNCRGENHVPSERLTFVPTEWLWLCAFCVAHWPSAERNVSGQRNNATRDTITA